MVELPQGDARRVRILEGATSVFLAYGFQRTTMEDIARAAEISRPALYLEFRNKADIYRALAADFLQKFLAATVAALAGGGSLAQRIEKAAQCNRDLFEAIKASPHGAEILDMKGSLAADIVADGRARMLALLEEAIAREGAAPGRTDDASPSPAALAGFILDALDGLHMRNPEAAEHRAAIGLYVRLALAALKP